MNKPASTRWSELEIAEAWGAEQGQAFRFRPHPAAKGGRWVKRTSGGWVEINEVFVRSAVIQFLQQLQQEGAHIRVSAAQVNAIVQLSQSLLLYRGLLAERERNA